MIKRYALIENNIVENVVVWDTNNGDIQDFTPILAVQSEIAEIGDQYINDEFVSSNNITEPSPEELIAQKETELLAMYNDLKALKGEQ